MPWSPIRTFLSFVVFALCATASTAVAQNLTVQEGTPVSLVAQSNVGAPDQGGFACGTNFGQTCYGGTLQPNGNINWTVDGSPVSSTYDQVDSYLTACGVDDAGREMDCPNFYDESGYTAVLPVGSHTIMASISAAQDQYAAFSNTWTVVVTAAPVKQTPSISVSCSPNPITFGAQNTTCSASQSGGTGTLIWSINGNVWTSSGVNASAMGFAGWAAGSYTLSVSYSGDSNYNSATASTVLTINPAPNPAPNPQGAIYNFIAKDSSGNSGYSTSGNLVAYTDSVTGSWGLVYDNLNRLHNATAIWGAYNSAAVTWEYDSFGNRLSQSHTGSPSVNIDDTWAHYDLPSNTTPHNRMTSASQPGVVADGSITYDGNGNLTYDGRRRYAYDVENRLCGVYDLILNGNITQYLYNAEGQRVAKGHPATTPSDPTQPYCTNGANFIVDEKYVLGLAGEQITQLDGANNWQHTNIWAGSQLLATYDQESAQQPLHFNVTDPLGTKRIQTTAGGVPELTCLSLPFGDGPDCSGSAQEATKHRFTNKQRDSESQLDYFGARYYSYNMGRWMSPDWADKPEAVPYSSLDNPQSLNLYGYVGNNPLSRADADGHCFPFCAPALALAGGGALEGVGAAALFSNPVGWTVLGVATVGIIGYEAYQHYNQNASANAPAASSTEQGRDAQGKFLPKQAGQTAPGADAEKEGLKAEGATKTGTTLPGTTHKVDGTVTDTGQKVDIKSGATVSNTKQLKATGDAARAATGQPLLVPTTNPNVHVTAPAAANRNLEIRPVKQPQQ